MFLTLELLDGILRGKCLTLRAGDSHLVGFAWDFLEGLYPFLGWPPRYFVISFDGFNGVLQRIAPGEDIRINSEQGSVLEDQAVLAVGDLRFRVHLHGMTVTPHGELAEMARQIAANGPLLALIDRCGQPELIPYLERNGIAVSCVYDGESAAKLAEVAPYVAEIGERPELLMHLLLLCGGHRCLSVWRTEDTLSEFRSRLRRLQYMKKPEGEVVYVRLQDSRTMGAFLTASTPEELEDWFGPVQFVVVEGSLTPGAYRMLAPGPEGVRVLDLAGGQYAAVG